MKLKFLERFKAKPTPYEKGEWKFKSDKGQYWIDYEITTEKGKLFQAFNLVKPTLPEQAKQGSETVFDSGKEIVLDKATLPKIEPVLVTQLNPQKYIFPEIKKDLPDFSHYNIKLAFASITKLNEKQFLMKLQLTGQCGRAVWWG